MKDFQKLRHPLCFIFFTLLFMSNIKAQILRLESFLPKEYNYNIKAEPPQDGIFATNYEAVDPKSGVATFEIIVNQMPKSLMNINGMEKGIEQNAKNYGADMQLTLLQKDNKDKVIRRLYQIKNNLSMVLMLMHQSEDNLTVVEVEFHPDDFELVSLEVWKKIFWQIQ